MCKWLKELFSKERTSDIPEASKKLIEEERNIENFSNGPKRPSDK